MVFATGLEACIRFLYVEFWLGVEVFLPKPYFLFNFTPLWKAVIVFLELTGNKCNYYLVSSRMLAIILYFHSLISLSLTFPVALGPYFWY